MLASVPTPRNLDELRKVRHPAEQALAAAAYIAEREKAISEARRIRDEAVRRYRKNHSLSETAAACGVSVATVKSITR